MIYLDNNATSFLDSQIAERMQRLAHQNLANPSSQHAAGREARAIVENAREGCLRFLGASTQGMASDALIFTSGGTEANNLAIAGLIEANPGRLIVSSIEHPSVLAAAERLEQQGNPVDRIQVRREGILDIEHLESLLRDPGKPKASVVSVMTANNETGAVQPLSLVANLCQEHQALLHCDAVQSVGKIPPFSFQSMKIDAMSLSAHKLHGPVGIGALVLRNGTKLAPQLFGGYQQQSMRPGTESPLLADALCGTLTNSTDAMRDMAATEGLRDRLEAGLLANLENVVILGANVSRLPHTSSVSFLGLDRQALQVALDMRGIACSTGSACASGSSQPSHVLQAMGVDSQTLKGAIRFSLSRYTQPEEIEQAIEIITQAVRALRRVGGGGFRT